MYPRRIHTNLLLAYSAKVLTTAMFLFLLYTIGVRNRKFPVRVPV